MQKIKNSLVFIFLIIGFNLSSHAQRNLESAIKELESYKVECGKYHKYKGDDSTYYLKLDSLKYKLDLFLQQYDYCASYLEVEAFYAKSIVGIRPKESVKIFYKNIEISREYGFISSEAFNTHELGKVYFSNEMMDDALSHFIISSNLFEKMEDWGAYAYSLIDIGNVYNRQHKMDKARSYYKKAENIFRTKKSPEEAAYDIAVCYNNYGQIAYTLDQNDSALYYFKLALEVRKSASLSSFYDNSYYYISYAYRKLGQIDSSIFYAKKAMEINLEHGYQLKIPFSIFYYAKALLFKDSSLAYEYALKGLESAKKRNDVQVIMNSQSLLSRYFSTINTDSCLKYYTCLYASSLEYNNIDYQKRSINGLIDNYAIKGDLKQQIKFLKLKNELYASLKRNVISMSEFELEEQQWRKERNKMLLLAERKQLQYYFAIIVSILFLLVILIVFISRRKIVLKSKELALLNRELKDVIRNRDILYAVIAHDLRGPLGTSNQILELMLSEEFDEKSNKDLLEKVKQSIGSTYSLLQNLLTWTNFKVGNISFSPEHQNVYNLLNDQVLLFKAQATDKNIKIVNELKLDTIAYYDFNTISTVIRNLISNAIKFSLPGNEIRVSSELVDKFIHIKVEDQGVGISAQNVELLFEENDSINTRGTDGESGSGLGLKLCKEFVELNNGKLWVKSQLNKGSVFSFSLPQKPNN